MCVAGVFIACKGTVVGDSVWVEPVVRGGGVCFEKSGCSVKCGYSW